MKLDSYNLPPLLLHVYEKEIPSTSEQERHNGLDEMALVILKLPTHGAFWRPELCFVLFRVHYLRSGEELPVDVACVCL